MSQVAMNLSMLAMMNKLYWDADNNVEDDEIAMYERRICDDGEADNRGYVN